MSDKVGMRNEMYKSVGGERGEALLAWRGSEASSARRKAKRLQCGERQSVADAEKSKRHQCREIEGYDGNDFRNRCEWFISASVVNCCEWFTGFVLRSTACSIGNDCESFGTIANHLSAANRCKSFGFVLRSLWIILISDGLGGLSTTVQGFIGDGLGSYRLGFFWDWGGLGSFGNEGEGCRLIGRK